jgi:hypothetical protein
MANLLAFNQLTRGTLGTGKSLYSKQSVFDANAHQPTGFLLLAINHLTEEKIVVIIDAHQRSVSQGLFEPDLGVAFAQVLDLTVKDRRDGSKNAHDGGLVLSFSLVGSHIFFSPADQFALQSFCEFTG